MTDWESIKTHFESKAKCKLGNKPCVHYEPGVTWIACHLGDGCKCQKNDGDGIPLTQFMAEWQERFA